MAGQSYWVNKGGSQWEDGHSQGPELPLSCCRCGDTSDTKVAGAGELEPCWSVPLGLGSVCTAGFGAGLCQGSRAGQCRGFGAGQCRDPGSGRPGARGRSASVAPSGPNPARPSGTRDPRCGRGQRTGQWQASPRAERAWHLHSNAGVRPAPDNRSPRAGARRSPRGP